MKRGTQKKISTPGQQKRWHIFGAYNWRTDKLFTMFAGKNNTASFCEFIDKLMNSTSGERPIVIVLDNASYHHSKESKAMLAYFEDRSMTFWLPPYCSMLNPIERYWRHLKEKACSNFLFKTVEDLIESVEKILAIQNDLTHSDRFLYSKTYC